MMDFINKIIQGNCLDVIKQIPDRSINCVITSPPYWQLRDYGWSGQWGLEPTYQEYLEHLWSLMDEIKRVLRDDGTVWVNLGDTYGTKSGSMGNGGFYPKNPVASNTVFEQSKSIHKCLLLIPHRFAIGCIDRGWIVRNDVIWAKRNGMPESCRDRFSKKHEYFFFMVKSEKYYFDLDGVRDKQKEVSLKRYEYEFTGQEGGKSNNMKGDKKHLATTKIPKEQSEMFGSPRARQHRPATHEFASHNDKDAYNPLGKNPGSVSDFWDIPTQPSSEKHYATFNTKLIDKPIIAGCPEGGIILDPFAGTATTLFRAYDLGRKYIGIEGKPEYVKIGQERVEQVQTQPKLF